MQKIYILLLFVPAILFSQIDKTIESGTLTNALGETVKFKKLRWEKDKAVYINSATNEEESLYETSITSIEKITEEQSNKDEEYSKVYKAANPYQNAFKTTLPDGQYLTKEDFMNATPTKNIRVTPKGLYGFTKPVVEDGTPHCFFFDDSERKVDSFAIVHKGFLYFKMSEILKNKNKNDRALDSDNPNAYSRVLFGDENYLYLEAMLGNPWEKGLNVNIGLPASMANSQKGIVWDAQNKEFNIFKNCEDFNNFIKDKSPEDVQKCNTKQVEIINVRMALQKIIGEN